MKKIGLVTLVGYFNYGNRLQNYALKIYLEQLGFEVDTLVFEPQPFLTDFHGENQTSKFQKIMRLPVRIINKLRHILLYESDERIRTEYFIHFTKAYLNEKKYSDADYDDYAYFVVGSDQVWNPNFIKNQPQFFLPFAKKEKKIAYSASFGLSHLNDYVESLYTPYLKDFAHLSVREDDGADLIKKMTGKKASVVLDPTMLLTQEDWSQISKPASNRAEGVKYLLTYFLDGSDDEQKERISDLSRTYGLEVIRMGERRDRETYRTSPEAFVDYIQNSSLFLTNSFHGVVFSILFHKPFVIYPRGNMNSRIETLLDKFHLTDRKASRIQKWDDALFQMDFELADRVLEQERKKADAYLRGALSSHD